MRASMRMPTREVRPEAEQGESEHDDEVRPEPLPVTVNRGNRVVDRVADQDRDCEREAGRDERTGEPEQDETPLLAPDAKQPHGRGDEAEIWRVDLHARLLENRGRTKDAAVAASAPNS